MPRILTGYRIPKLRISSAEVKLQASRWNSVMLCLRTCTNAQLPHEGMCGGVRIRDLALYVVLVHFAHILSFSLPQGAVEGQNAVLSQTGDDRSAVPKSAGWSRCQVSISLNLLTLLQSNSVMGRKTENM